MTKNAANVIEKKIKYYYLKYRLVINYGIIGISGVTIHMIIVLIMSTFFLRSPYYTWINYLLGAFIGLTNNFFWNAFVNFKTGKDKIFQRFITFGIVGIIGMVITAPIVQLNTTFFRIDPLISTGIGIVISAILQFTLNKRYSFKV